MRSCCKIFVAASFFGKNGLHNRSEVTKSGVIAINKRVDKVPLEIRDLYEIIIAQHDLLYLKP